MADLLAFISTNHIVQAVIIGAVFAFLTANLIIDAKIKTIQMIFNGWSTSLICGQPGNGILLRAAGAKYLPGVNAAQEAVYWTATADSTGKRLNGRHAYTLHFPAGQQPPNDAFWSLTMTDTQGYMMDDASERHSVGDRSGLVTNPDGSIDIYIQNAAPEQNRQNWLPAPTGSFKLMLRAYLPGQEILDGVYRLPPVIKVR